MMKKNIVFCVLISTIFCSYAQLTKYYSVTIKKSDENYYGIFRSYSYDLKFYLCECGNYYIRLDENSTGSMDAHTTLYYISYGSYKIKNDTLLLTDSYTHHQMIFKFDDTYAEPVKVFPFMMDYVFTDLGKIQDYYYNWVKCDLFDEFPIPIEIEKRISDFKKENTQENPLEQGKYFWGPYEIKFTDERYKLSLNLNVPNNSKLELLFFIGKWEREGNILTLWDTNFEHPFYGLIREDGIDLLIFAIYDSLIFKKE